MTEEEFNNIITLYCLDQELKVNEAGIIRLHIKETEEEAE